MPVPTETSYSAPALKNAELFKGCQDGPVGQLRCKSMSGTTLVCLQQRGEEYGGTLGTDEFARKGNRKYIRVTTEGYKASSGFKNCATRSPVTQRGRGVEL